MQTGNVFKVCQPPSSFGFYAYACTGNKPVAGNWDIRNTVLEHSRTHILHGTEAKTLNIDCMGRRRVLVMHYDLSSTVLLVVGVSSLEVIRVGVGYLHT